MEKYLTPAQLAAVLNVRPGTVYSWLSRGIPIPNTKIGGTVRFSEKSVAKWLEEQERARRKRKFEL